MNVVDLGKYIIYRVIKDVIIIVIYFLIYYIFDLFEVLG